MEGLLSTGPTPSSFPGTTLHTDGWRAYRRLPTIGYHHRWLDHTKHYVDLNDPTLHTNGIEGLWGTFKRWLPQQGRYNLEEYMWLYVWEQNKRLSGEDQFTALVKLVLENNSSELLEQVNGTNRIQMQIQMQPLLVMKKTRTTRRKWKQRMRVQMMRIQMKRMKTSTISLIAFSAKRSSARNVNW